MIRSRVRKVMMKASRLTILVHGGAGECRPGRRKAGIARIKLAVKTGFDILEDGGNSLDSVECVVLEMEDNQVF